MVEFTYKPSSPRLVCWKFLNYWFSFITSNWYIQIFDFMIQSWKIVFLGIYLFLLGCPICYHKLFIVVSDDPLYFCGSSCNFFFISDFIYLGPLFFLMSLVKGLSILFILSKNQLFVSLIFSLVFSLFFICFISDLYYFLPSTNFAFVCSSFSSSFR